jgi:hypothetical protein
VFDRFAFPRSALPASLSDQGAVKRQPVAARTAHTMPLSAQRPVAASNRAPQVTRAKVGGPVVTRRAADNVDLLLMMGLVLVVQVDAWALERCKDFLENFTLN